MGRSDWLAVGLKLLGVYFAVTGVASLWNTLLVLIVVSSHGGSPTAGTGTIGILEPAVYLLAAFFLVYLTPNCVRWLGEPPPDKPA